MAGLSLLITPPSVLIRPCLNNCVSLYKNAFSEQSTSMWIILFYPSHNLERGLFPAPFEGGAARRDPGKRDNLHRPHSETLVWLTLGPRSLSPKPCSFFSPILRSSWLGTYSFTHSFIYLFFLSSVCRMPVLFGSASGSSAQGPE